MTSWARKIQDSQQIYNEWLIGPRKLEDHGHISESCSKLKIRLLGFEFPRLTAQAKLEGQVRHFYYLLHFMHVAFSKIDFKNSVFEKLGGKLYTLSV